LISQVYFHWKDIDNADIRVNKQIKKTYLELRRLHIL
jgi:hypothetical protein